MRAPLALHGILHVTSPWGADLVVRARGEAVELHLPRRRDLARIGRLNRELPVALRQWPEALRATGTHLAIFVRGHQVAERRAGHNWRPRWGGMMKAGVGRARELDTAR